MHAGDGRGGFPGADGTHHPAALVIHGDKDASAPLERGRRTAAALANSELRVYEGAPHGLFMTHRERLNADLLDFIAE